MVGLVRSISFQRLLRLKHPGSFLEFLPILDRLRTNYVASNLPYHILVPSLPGYAFSSLPTDRDINLGDVARILRKLMANLGFGNGYIAQGGDLGSSIARILAMTDPSCKGLPSLISVSMLWLTQTIFSISS